MVKVYLVYRNGDTMVIPITLDSSWMKAGASSISPKYMGFVISRHSLRRECENGSELRRFLSLANRSTFKSNNKRKQQKHLVQLGHSKLGYNHVGTSLYAYLKATNTPMTTVIITINAINISMRMPKMPPSLELVEATDCSPVHGLIVPSLQLNQWWIEQTEENIRSAIVTVAIIRL